MIFAWKPSVNGKMNCDHIKRVITFTMITLNAFHWIETTLHFLLFFNDFQISWIRHHDISLLTVGRYTYTSDQRFSAYHVPMTHFWQLRIRNVSHSDAGKYECQVSTTPPMGKIISLAVVGKFGGTRRQSYKGHLVFKRS